MTTAKTKLLGILAVAGIVLAAGPAGAGSITIANGDFQAPKYDEDGPGGVADWYWVPYWDEGGASYWGAGYVYLDAGGWVSQNLGYYWTAADVFTLGIRGNQGWRTGGTFKIQLREADGTVLWDSGTVSVDSTWQNFSWNIDASTFSGAGVTPGSQLNIRMDCLANTVYLDDVTLSTTLTDTTAPTLAGSAMVDNKSGGPVNPGQLVTYTVTFSEGMNSGTVSSSDFDNGGTAAVLVGTPTTSGGVSYSIPVVASSTGTLQLRVPVGATLTDLAGNPLDTASAILDNTTIDVVAKTIGVTGGDFEVPYTNDQPGDVPLWFDSTITYADWHNAARYSANGSQTALLLSYGYIYQSLGQLAAGTRLLEWSFDQVKGTGTAGLRFFYGVSTGVGEGVDIDTLGFTQIGSTVSFPGTSGNVVVRSGSVDVSAVPAGATIWMDFTDTGGDEFLLDNISVASDTMPPTLASSAIEDDKSGGPVPINTLVTYTVTFSEDMDSNTVSAADFDNAGSAAVTIGTVSETTPTSGIFTVPVTADGDGSLQLKVNTGAELKDVAGNLLDTASAILDDTTITVTASDTTAPTLAGSAIVDDKSGGLVVVGSLVTYTVTFSEDMDSDTVSAADFGNAGSAAVTIGTVTETTPTSGIFTVPVTADGTGSLQLQVKAGVDLKDVAGNSLATSSAILDNTTLNVVPQPSTPIAIGNFNFEAPLFDEDGAGGSPDWHWVPDWDELNASYIQSAPGLGSGRCLYMDAGGWVSQNLGYNWTAAEVFALGIKGNRGWNTGNAGSFEIQLREADGTVLWDSGTTPVTSTVSNFSWSIDASTFSGAGVTPGSQLNIRIECLAFTVYLDDVTLLTSLADTTAPSLPGASIVDNKSGGPINPGQPVTYTVTFSEGMNSGTVSSSDFDNGGTAAILIGTPTTSDGVSYSIPLVASSTGTLQLRVPAGATMTDLSGNALNTSSAILDNTTINVVAKPIAVTGCDFELPYTNDQPGDVPLWFDNTVTYSDWHNAARYSGNGSQTALINYYGGVHGYIYQSLGQLAAGTESLEWSFDQVKQSGTADLRFFYGVSTGVGEGVDIDTLGLTQIGSTVSFPVESANVVFRSGSVDVSAVPAGATVWMDFSNTAGAFLLDNIYTFIPAGSVFRFR